MKRPVMRYHGGKFRLADWVISFFPYHMTYVEPFGGAAGVLMKKERAYAEVYNDLDSDVVNLFRVLRNKDQVSHLRDQLVLTPYSRDEFIAAYQQTSDPVEKARRLLVRSYMGFGSAAATKQNTGFRIDSARIYGTTAHLWAEMPLFLDSFWHRLQGVIIENRTALQVIENHDRKETLFYVDPPYVHDTRNIRNTRCYRHEMTDDDHEALLKALKSVDGMVALSGYDTDMYNDILAGWVKHSTRSRMSAGGGAKIKIENLWLNPQCAAFPRQMDLVDEAAL